MALTPRLDIRQSQTLAMTPRLQQAIRLLTLSNLELEAELAAEIDKNPLLEIGGEAGEPADGGSESDGDPIAPARTDAAQATDTLFEQGGEGAADALDADFAGETFHHDSASDAAWDSAGNSGGGTGANGGEGIDFDSFGAPPISLHDHVAAQLGALLSGDDLSIAMILVEAMDDAGYISIDLADLAIRLHMPLTRVGKILTIIQQCDPSGVGARDLAECLAIQAREADRYDPMMARLIDNLDLLARGQISQLRRICNADEEDMTGMIRELRGYDPKPGLRFAAATEAAPVTPDVFVRAIAGGWAVEINADTLPRVLVNRRYYAELSSITGKGPQRSWLSECLASANWLVKALDQRQQTIIKVTQEIVRQQEGFFLHGVAALKPLTLRQVADNVGLHESTVSRVTSNKYLSCARGTHELKYFFSSGIASADGEDGMSAEAIKRRIKALIDGEAANAILSDDTLVDMLVKEGCPIARRTVAKYREAMGIGSSVQRRRAKAIGL